MATQKSNTALINAKTKSKMTADPVRPLANFPSSIWGDRLRSLPIDNSELKTYGKVIEKQKQELRRLIIDPSMDSNTKLSLINSVYRLGLTYLFEEEIEGQLDKLFKEFDMQECNEADLYTISVNFQVFRQHGYRLSCDVFNRFKDYTSDHKFKEYIMADVRGMLGLYESTQLRIRGETILEEAFAFTESQLKGVLDTLEGNLARQVKHALTSPFHRGLPTVEARIYFSNYEEECSTYDSLLKLANAHFNYLQVQHKEEIGSVIKWGEDTDFKTVTPYARDRLPDLYLWGLGLFSEPHYSEARILISKMAQLICVLDDTYDAYATIDELQLLTNAINRWELSATEQLPEYMKPLYKVLLNEHAELQKQLSSKGKSKFVNASKQAFQELVMGYLQEAEWRHNGQVPSFQEYLKNGLITSTYYVFEKSSLICMSDIATEEACTWYDTDPKILQAARLLGRVYNDISSYQFERKRAQQQITSIDAYMKTFGVPEIVALEELKKMVENAWNDINEGCLNPTEISNKLLAPILNLARMTDVIYRYNDKFTFPEKTIEEYITLIFIESIPKY